jgi:hypothetical protein
MERAERGHELLILCSETTRLTEGPTARAGECGNTLRSRVVSSK